MKKSKLEKHLRELMAGENQCVTFAEWASELPD